MDVTERVGQLGRKADSSDVVDNLVRVGLLSYGVVHLLIAWLALRIAFGHSGRSASSTGALSELAKSAVGQVSLFVVGVGFLSLVGWQAFEAATGHRREEGGRRVAKRAASVGKVVVYGALAVSALRIAVGAGSTGGKTDPMTARLMSMPGGTLLVGAVGVAILAVAGFLAHRGWTQRFTQDLGPGAQSGDRRPAIVTLGMVGYVAKGVALAVVGALFLWAALTHDPQKSGGLDQALRKVQQEPFGVPVLAVIALGIACFGLYCFAWARHLER